MPVGTPGRGRRLGGVDVVPVLSVNSAVVHGVAVELEQLGVVHRLCRQRVEHRQTQRGNRDRPRPPQPPSASCPLCWCSSEHVRPSCPGQLAGPRDRAASPPRPSPRLRRAEEDSHSHRGPAALRFLNTVWCNGSDGSSVRTCAAQRRSSSELPTSISIRRSRGSDRPTTVCGSPSTPSTYGPPRPSMVNAPATRSGSPVAT